MRSKKILLLPTADWDHPIQTNKQHVARQLERLGFSVLYVESLALRAPSRSAVGDRLRMTRRLRSALRVPRRVSPRIAVASPLVIPLWSKPPIVFLNRIALAIQYLLWMVVWGRPELVISYSPIADVLPVRLRSVVYHCVDDIGAQPQMPTDFIRAHEKRLIRGALGVVTTSSSLGKRAAELGARRVLAQTNVVDPERFHGLAAPSGPKDASDPVHVGFLGAVSPYKVDFDWIVAAAQRYPDWTFDLYGPVGEGEPGSDAAVLNRLPNVQLHGPVPYDEVPSTMAAFDVAMLPTPFNEYTDGMFPMKFFEYLAAGVPVVATAISSLRPFANAALLATDREQFLEMLAVAAAGGGPTLEARLAALEGHTYESRTTSMLEEISHW